MLGTVYGVITLDKIKNTQKAIVILALLDVNNLFVEYFINIVFLHCPLHIIISHCHLLIAVC